MGLWSLLTAWHLRCQPLFHPDLPTPSTQTHSYSYGLVFIDWLFHVSECWYAMAYYKAFLPHLSETDGSERIRESTKNDTQWMHFEHIREMRALSDTEIHIESTQRSSLLIGFFICEENSLAPTWSECISGYTWISVKHLSLHMCSLEGGGHCSRSTQGVWGSGLCTSC